MNHAEDALQIAVAEFLRRALKPHECLWWHCPNGGRRDVKTAARLKRMGVLPGVADLEFLWPNGRGFIELKSETGTLEDEQKVFRDQVLALGAFWRLARSVDDVERVLRAWRVPLHASVLPRSEIVVAEMVGVG